MHLPGAPESAALVAEVEAALAARRDADVVRLTREGLTQYPDSRWLRAFLAEALLMLGDYRDGFRELEGRTPRFLCPAKNLPYPEWDGTIAGRSILVWGEQGIGDEIQAARFLPRLKAQGARQVTFACWDVSVRVFGQLGVDAVVSRVGNVSIQKHDCWTSMWSLPHHLGVDRRDISGAPYLSATPTGRGGIGLVERGSANNARDTLRSMPDGVLQAAVPQGFLLQPAGDVADSLARVAGLDLVITVDTSWAHMAGALGVPCWVLLPHHGFGHDWRWGREGERSLWYDSLRLIRQGPDEDWAAVAARVAEDLRAGAPLCR